MARIVEDSSHYEIWKNAGRSRVVIKRTDRRGELKDELIGSERTFHLTPAERRFNQELAASENYDPFSNGQFVPVQLIETTEDVDKIRSNPNVIGDSEIGVLLDGKQTNWRAFDQRLAEISNALVLERMLQRANEGDATVRQVQAIQARLEEVAPAVYTEIRPAGDGQPLPAPRVTQA